MAISPLKADQEFQWVNTDPNYVFSGTLVFTDWLGGDFSDSASGQPHTAGTGVVSWSIQTPSMGSCPSLLWSQRTAYGWSLGGRVTPGVGLTDLSLGGFELYWYGSFVRSNLDSITYRNFELGPDLPTEFDITARGYWSPSLAAPIPDATSTLGLVGFALAGFALLRRRFVN